jgi:hypothetical protein
MDLILEQQQKVIQGAVVNQILVPQKSDVLFTLDGTISGNNAVDLKNGWLFPLSSAPDWDTTKKVFPYKTNITISAPANGTAAATAIQAVDVNNFWYASNGAANAIPFISFFQNIDYVNKCFCLEVAQVVSSNVETQFAGVKDITLYTTARTTTNLTECNTYYGVPAKSGTNKWVAIGGDNGAAGTEAAPWATIVYAVTQGVPFYVKTGVYDLGGATRSTTKSIYGLGGVVINNSAGFAMNINQHNITLERLVFNTPNSNGLNIVDTGTGCVVNKCKVNSNAQAFQSQLNNGTITISNSILLINNVNSFFVSAHATALVMNGNYFGGVSGVGIKVLSGANISVTYNKIYGTIPFFINSAASVVIGTITSTGNIGSYTGAYIVCYDVGNTTTKYDNLTLSSYYFRTTDTTPLNSAVSIKNNTIQSSSTNPIISILDKSFDIQDNFLVGLTGSNATPISIDAKAIINTGNKINYNTIHQKGAGGCIMIGLTLTVTNLISGECIGNKILGQHYWGVAPGSAHGIQVANNDGWLFKYNYINGAGMNLIFKVSGVDLDTPNNIAEYNILVNGGFYNEGGKNAKFYNNIIYNDTYDIYCIQISKDYTATYGTSGLLIKNNILINKLASPSTSSRPFWIASSGCSWVSDNNLIHSTNTETAYVDGYQKTFAQWQALGYDTNSLNLSLAQANALFTDQGNRIFTPAVGSLAIGAGATLDAAYDDGLDASTVWGSENQLPIVVTKQQGSNWDIGAYIH